jgi:hypothetical protein
MVMPLVYVSGGWPFPAHHRRALRQRRGAKPQGHRPGDRHHSYRVQDLALAASHSAQLYLSGSLTVLALGGLAVSYAAIAMLVTGRGWVIATVAALLGGVGAFSGAMLNVLVGVNLAAAASAHMTQQAAALFLVTSFHSVPAQVATDVYFLSEFVAPVVMGLLCGAARASHAGWLSCS